MHDGLGSPNDDWGGSTIATTLYRSCWPMYGDHIAEEFQALVERYVTDRYGPGGRGRVERPAAPPARTIPIKSLA